MDKLRKGMYYFSPMARFWFEESALLLGESAFSDENAKCYRFDLRYSIGRLKTLAWNSDYFDNRSLLEEYINSSQSASWSSQIIDTDKVHLTALSKAGTPKNTVLVHAANGKYFTSIELLWLSAQLQRTTYSYQSNGVGIYRSGSKAGVPTYYIGEFVDRAGVLKHYESIGIDTNA
jgi:hypothetical protein